MKSLFCARSTRKCRLKNEKEKNHELRHALMPSATKLSVVTCIIMHDLSCSKKKRSYITHSLNRKRVVVSMYVKYWAHCCLIALKDKKISSFDDDGEAMDDINVKLLPLRLLHHWMTAWNFKKKRAVKERERRKRSWGTWVNAMRDWSKKF